MLPGGAVYVEKDRPEIPRLEPDTRYTLQVFHGSSTVEISRKSSKLSSTCVSSAPRIQEPRTVWRTACPEVTDLRVQTRPHFFITSYCAAAQYENGFEVVPPGIGTLKFCSASRSRHTCKANGSCARSRGNMPAMSTCKSTALLCLLSLRLAAAHEHHDDQIPDGQAISPDPIVRFPVLASTLTFA